MIQRGTIAWHALAEEKPPNDEIVLIFAESADPARPLIHVCWWSEGSFHLATPWQKAVTHWAYLPESPQAPSMAPGKSR